MVSLDQIKIAEYLLDYANLNVLMLQNQDKSFKTLFYEYMSNNCREENYETYYKYMVNNYMLFLRMKSYCVCEDYNLKNKNNFINNEKLNLSDLRKKIVTGTDSANISDKKLLQLIRDVFCHSTSDNQLYSISPNGKKIEIRIKNPSPITIKLELNDIAALIREINYNTQSVQLIGLEWEKNIYNNLKDYLNSLKINRYHFTKKIDEDIVDSINENSENKDYKNVIAEAESTEGCEVKELRLTEEDINEIINKVNNLRKNNIITEEEYKKNFYQIINILINEKFPIPVFKSSYYDVDSFAIHYLQSTEDFSYNVIYYAITEIIPKKDELKLSYKDQYEKIFNDEGNKLLFKIYYSDFNKKRVYSYMPFIEYIITNYCCDSEYIKIGKRSVLSNKIRNSLIHARWCIDKDKIKFYDALPNISNELDYNWEASINFNDLCEYCVDILSKELQKQEEKQKVKTVKFYS